MKPTENADKKLTQNEADYLRWMEEFEPDDEKSDSERPQPEKPRDPPARTTKR